MGKISLFQWGAVVAFCACNSGGVKRTTDEVDIFAPEPAVVAPSVGETNVAGTLHPLTAPAPAQDCTAQYCQFNQVCDGPTCTCSSGFVRRGDVCLPAGTCGEIACPVHSHCEANECRCDDDSLKLGEGCWPQKASPPTTHTAQQVCGAWQAGHIVTDVSPWSQGPSLCDPGSLSAAAVADTLNRLAMYRWMAGENPVSEDTQHEDEAMACAATASWNPTAGHFPKAGMQCFSEHAAVGAASSNIAWGNKVPADAIDNYVDDGQNTKGATYGHRLWALSPLMQQTAIGFYAGGGTLQRAQCLRVPNDSSEKLPSTQFAWPPAGFVPTAVAKTAGWTFTSTDGLDSPTVKVTRQSDGARLEGTVQVLPAQRSKRDSLVYLRHDWEPQAGETYRVVIEDSKIGEVTYDVNPVDCAPMSLDFAMKYHK